MIRKGGRGESPVGHLWRPTSRYRSGVYRITLLEIQMFYSDTADFEYLLKHEQTVCETSLCHRHIMVSNLCVKGCGWRVCVCVCRCVGGGMLRPAAVEELKVGNQEFEVYLNMKISSCASLYLLLTAACVVQATYRYYCKYTHTHTRVLDRILQLTLFKCNSFSK